MGRCFALNTNNLDFSENIPSLSDVSELKPF
jgi:hypothetical protein